MVQNPFRRQTDRTAVSSRAVKRRGLKIRIASLESDKIVIIVSRNRQTRNSSGDEIANVNFLCDDIVHALKIQYTLA